MVDESVAGGREMEEETGQVNRGCVRWEEAWVYLQCRGELWKGSEQSSGLFKFYIRKGQAEVSGL